LNFDGCDRRDQTDTLLGVRSLLHHHEEEEEKGGQGPTSINKKGDIGLKQYVYTHGYASVDHSHSNCKGTNNNPHGMQ
jgi:hypothetical protein